MAKIYDYDKDVDYSLLMEQAANKKDYASAALYEQQRNAKIQGEGMDYATTNKYSQYLMPDGYNGSSNNVYTHNDNQSRLQQQMNQNSIDWWNADAAGKKTLEEANRQLAAQLGGNVGFDSQTGMWSGVANQPVSLKTGVDFEMPTFDYDAYLSSNPKPTFESQYSERIDALLNQILNREKFSYDAETDPLYQQYKKQYIREGNRAMNDTLAAMASGAGGMNTWAATAAQQANDYYMAQLGDKIPELYQLAYSMYMDDLAGQRADLNMLQGLDDTDYNRYRDDVSDWYDDRDFVHGDYRDKMGDFQWGTTFNYNAEQDEFDKQWQQKEWDYNVEQNALDRAENNQSDAYDRAMDMLLMGVMPNSALLAKAGITDAEAKAIKAANTATLVTTTQTGGNPNPGKTGSKSDNTSDDKDDDKPVVDDTPAKKDSGSVVQKPNADKPSNVQAYTDTGTGEADPEIENRHSDDWVTIPGHGRYSWTEVEAYVNKGIIKEEKTAGGKLRYTWVG